MLGKPFETRIQELVYNVDVGIGLRLIKLGLYILFVLSLMALYTATQFRGLTDAEAMDFAQLARNLMKKGEFVTSYIRPVSMWYLKEHAPQPDPRVSNHPDIVHAPAYPAALAAGFMMMESAFTTAKSARTYPPEQWVIVPFGHLCTLLTGLLVFFLARRLFDARVALMGATLYFLSDSVWKTSISGTPVALAGLFTMLSVYGAVWAAARAQEGRRWPALLPPFLLAAACCILAFLTRYALGVLAPALALFLGLSLRRNRWRWVVAFLLLFVAGIAPWLLRNLQVSGGLLGLAPHLAINGIDVPGENTFERMLAPVMDSEKLAQGLQIKWLTNLAALFQGPLRSIGDGVLICLFITTFLYGFVREHVRRLRWCLALSLILFLMVAAAYGPETARLLQVFWPFVILYGVAFFFILLERMQIKVPIVRIGVLSAMFFLQSLPLIFTLLPPRATVPYPPYFPPYITHVCRMLEPDEWLCTDMPWATAWYGERESLLLPSTVTEFYEINDYSKRISGLYFTTITRDRPYARALMTGPYEQWFPIMEGRIPSGFPLTQGFPLGNMDQVFITDRRRWEEP